MKFTSRLRHNNSKTQKHKEKYGIIVKENEFIQPENDEKVYKIFIVIKGCRENFFHTFEYRCVYDNEIYKQI